MPNPNGVTLLNKQTIIERFLGGETGKSIGNTLGLSENGILSQLRRWGCCASDRPPRLPKTTATEQNIIYVAGLFDGEGSICIYKSLLGSIQLGVSVAMTNEAIVRLLHEWFGGSCSEHEPRNPKHKKQWRWGVVGRRAGWFLSLVEPYLHVKCSQANAAIMLAGTYFWPNVGGKLSDETSKLRTLCLQATKNANRRGALR